MLESSLVRMSKLVLVLLLGLLAWSAVGRADVAPADECTMPGQPCTNTDPNRGDVGKKGICMSDTCTRSGVGDGGVRVPVEYECNRCVATDATDAGSGGGGKDDGGCSVRGAAAGGTLALIGVALALLAGRLRRRP